MFSIFLFIIFIYLVLGTQIICGHSSLALSDRLFICISALRIVVVLLIMALQVMRQAISFLVDVLVASTPGHRRR